MRVFDRAGGIIKFARFLYKQRIRGFDVPDEPHLDEGATVELRKQLEAANFYLEFGTGGSTVLAARHGIETIAVDNDKYFARAVKKKLASGHRVTVIEIDLGTVGPWGWPLFDRPTPRRTTRWRDYIDVPMREVARRGRFPDFVLVDGRMRSACAIETARLALAAGVPCTIMLDDYAGRASYWEIEAYLGAPRRVGRAAVFHVKPGMAGLAIDRDVSERFMRDLA